MRLYLLTKNIIVLGLLLTFGTSTSACTVFSLEPEIICLQDGFDPKKKEFKECFYNLMQMPHSEYGNLHDPCYSGGLRKNERLSDYPREIVDLVVEIREEYLESRKPPD